MGIFGKKRSKEKDSWWLVPNDGSDHAIGKGNLFRLRGFKSREEAEKIRPEVEKHYRRSFRPINTRRK